MLKFNSLLIYIGSIRNYEAVEKFYFPKFSNIYFVFKSYDTSRG